VPPLLIRRTHEEVVCEGYTVPPQHHSVVEVQPQYCCGYIMHLLKQAAAKVGCVLDRACNVTVMA